MDLRPYLQINRKISGHMTHFFVRMGVTPNFLTGLGLASGLAAGLAVSGGSRGALLVGALFLHLQFLLDNCDGELARLKSMHTRFGKWFDLISDVVVDQALWFGLFAASFMSPVAHTAIWFASVGSLINAGVTLRERHSGCSTSIHANRPAELKKNKLIHSFLEVLSHNGDSILVVWIFALIGDPVVFLVCGAAFINMLWIWRTVVNFSRLVSMRALKIAGQIAACALGVWILHQVLHDVSLPDLKTLLMKGGLGFLFVFLVYPVVCLFHSAGHYFLFSVEARRRMSFYSFYWVYLAGDSINKITPFVDIGGEPLKILFAYKRGLATLDESIIAAWIARVQFVITEIIYVIAGLMILWYIRPSLEMTWIALGGIAMSTGLVAGFFYAQKKGLVQFIARFASKLDGMPKAGVSELVDLTERGLRSFYTHRKRDYAVCLLWNLAGWIFFLYEVYVAFHILGVEITLAQAFIIQSLLQAATTVTFFIPASIGAQENGLAYLLTHLGFSATHGFALSIIKRLRQVAWAVVAPLGYLVAGRVRAWIVKFWAIQP